jgi:hypothetical protein
MVLVISLFICDKIPNVDMTSARIVKPRTPRKHLEIKPLEAPKPNGSQEILGRGVINP